MTETPECDEPELIARLLDAQQDITFAANCGMDQSLANAAALIDEIEPVLRLAIHDAARTAELEADALRYRYLREHCSSHYPMTWEQPAEWSIQWEFQQGTPAERYGSIDKWIDADIAALDEDERTALASSNTAGGAE